MNWDFLILSGVVFGLLSVVAFLTWVYIRRDIRELTSIPALKKFKRWQLVLGYLILWLAVTLIIERL